MLETIDNSFLSTDQQFFLKAMRVAYFRRNMRNDFVLKDLKDSVSVLLIIYCLSKSIFYNSCTDWVASFSCSVFFWL